MYTKTASSALIPASLAFTAQSSDWLQLQDDANNRISVKLVSCPASGNSAVHMRSGIRITVVFVWIIVIRVDAIVLELLLEWPVGGVPDVGQADGGVEAEEELQRHGYGVHEYPGEGAVDVLLGADQLITHWQQDAE